MLDLTTRWNARSARTIIAISEATKRDLIDFYGTPAGKIEVVHHGVGPDFHPRTQAEIASTLDRLGIRQPYILSVGTVQPRKNFGRLAAATASVERAGLPHQLVIAGKRGWLADRVDREMAASGQRDRVQTLGYVAPIDLPALYSGASAFCLPSLYEGFGLPVLEAMASGTPVIASHSSALGEVAGAAAITVDPTNVDAIGDALVRVLADDALAKELRDTGLRRAAEFTWERTARATLEILRRVRDA
jgi:glycosyltransferase involved in cell wall biosynthesis